MAILQDLSQLSREQLIAKIEVMKAQAQSKLTLRVTDKGGVSLYGLGRFPVTLYASQWTRLLAERDRISAFMAENQAKLATKE